jgi:outer membrane protein OmpA-like peptidoglycan-associated protein
MAATAPLPAYEKVAFDANVLFGSGKSALRRAGRDTLDQFIASIYGLDSRTIVAIGYADRMGLPTPKNVACMQPDRHVFIEVSGTRIAK